VLGVASCYRRFAARFRQSAVIELLKIEFIRAAARLFGSPIDKGAVRSTAGRRDRSEFQLFRRQDGDFDIPLAMTSRFNIKYDSFRSRWMCGIGTGRRLKFRRRVGIVGYGFRAIGIHHR
jgi:hypothetical protein